MEGIDDDLIRSRCLNIDRKIDCGVRKFIVSLLRNVLLGALRWRCKSLLFYNPREFSLLFYAAHL